MKDLFNCCVKYCQKECWRWHLLLSNVVKCGVRDETWTTQLLTDYYSLNMGRDGAERMWSGWLFRSVGALAEDAPVSKGPPPTVGDGQQVLVRGPQRAWLSVGVEEDPWGMAIWETFNTLLIITHWRTLIVRLLLVDYFACRLWNLLAQYWS